MSNLFATEEDLAETRALAEAKAKFEEMDDDGNGTLEGAEISRLADWMWTAFHPNGKPVPAAQREKMTGTLNKRVADSITSYEIQQDDNEEFLKCDVNTLERTIKQLANGTACTFKIRAVNGISFEHFAEWFAGISKDVHRMEMRAAHKKFKEMDDDNSGYLDHDEIRHMAEWMSTCLHPGGKPMTDKAKEKMTAKLTSRVTEDPEGKISFDQFEKWYTRTARQMNSFAIRQYEKTHEPEKVAVKKAVVTHVVAETGKDVFGNDKKGDY